MIAIKNVRKYFGGIHALDDCSLDIKKNSITAIIGPNGSGKSTLFNVISGLYRIDAGNIIFESNDISAKSDVQIAQLGIARTFQQVRLFEYLTIRDHIELALNQYDHKLFKNFLSNTDTSDSKIQEALDLVGLDKPLHTIVTDLSYGQRKLLDLAVAIAKPHHVLLLDEPVAGVNPRLRNQIKQIIRTLKKKGHTIVVIEHDMNFVMDLAEDVFVMDAGAVIAHGLPKDIQNNKRVLEAYLGE